MSKENLYTSQVVFLGDITVGEANYYVSKSSEELNLTTAKLEVAIDNNEGAEKSEVTLMMWDSAGQTEDSTQSHLQKANAIFVGFDVRDRESFNKVKQHVERARRYCDGNAAIFLVATNKADDAKENKVSTEEAERLANGLKLKYFETNSRQGGVPSLLQAAADDLFRKDKLQDFAQKLEKYIDDREKDRRNSWFIRERHTLGAMADLFFTCFGGIPHTSAKIKLSAAEKVLAYIRNDSNAPDLNDLELKALKDGRLGKLIKDYQTEYNKLIEERRSLSNNLRH